LFDEPPWLCLPRCDSTVLVGSANEEPSEEGRFRWRRLGVPGDLTEETAEDHREEEGIVDPLSPAEVLP